MSLSLKHDFGSLLIIHLICSKIIHVMYTEINKLIYEAGDEPWEV